MSNLRVLIAYDGSPAAGSAITAAGALWPGASAVVLVVHEAPLAIDGAGRAGRIAVPDHVIERGVAELDRAIVEAAQTLATQGAELAQDAGLLPEPVCVAEAGPTWHAIERVGGERGVDVLACGRRGDGGLGRALLGSTSAALLHHSTLPVLVVPEGLGAPRTGPVVVGWDGSAGAQAAVEAAGRLLAGREAEIVYSWRLGLGRSVTGIAALSAPLHDLEELTQALVSAQTEAAAEQAEAGAVLARGCGLVARAQAAEAPDATWSSLWERAAAVDAVAVVVGSRGLGGVASALLGSVSAGVIANATGATLVVPSDRSEAATACTPRRRSHRAAP